MSNHIDRDVINALIAGHFADPFSVLGMHRTCLLYTSDAADE